MGFISAALGRAAKAALANGAKAAKQKGKQASKHYCPGSDNGKHSFTKWMNEEHPNTGATHGPGIHNIFYCKNCGFTR